MTDRRAPGPWPRLCMRMLFAWQASAVRLGSRKGGSPAAGRSYILHEPHPSHEGIGSSLQFVKPLMEVAQRHNLTYVCQAKDFKSAGHYTQNLGFLFGCYNSSFVVGDLEAYDKVKADATLSTVNAAISGIDAALYYPHHVRTQYDIGIPLPIEPNTVYYVNQQQAFFSWGVSYKWFRSQYDLVRRQVKSRHDPDCGNSRRDKKSVVLHIRRGDAPNKKPMRIFTALLDKLFAGKIPGADIREDQAHILVISEALQSSKSDWNDFSVFGKYNKSSSVSLFIGQPELDPQHARDRLIRDLDCMSTADVLILSGGGFSSLAAALLNDDGISLTVEGNTRGRFDMPVGHPDVPNVREVDLPMAILDPRRGHKSKGEARDQAAVRQVAMTLYGEDPTIPSEHYWLDPQHEGLPNALLLVPAGHVQREMEPEI